MKKKTKGLLGITGLAIVIFLATFFWDDVQILFWQFNQTLDTYVNLHPFLGVLFFIGFAALSILLGPFSSAPLVPSAVVIWGPVLTTIYLLAGWIVGNTIAFGIGYFLAFPLVTRIVGEGKMRTWLSTIDKRVDFGTALVFRVAMPSETGYIFGIVKYSFYKYMLITLLAEVPFAILTVYAGDQLTNSSWATFTMTVTIYIGAIIFSSILLKRKLRK